MKIIVFDTEATDLTPGQICQLSYLMIDGGSVTGKNLFFTVDDMSEGAYEVHGLSMDELETLSGGERFEDRAAEIFADFSACDLLIGHNVSADDRYIRVEFERCGLRLGKKKTFCTMNYFTSVMNMKCKINIGRPKPPKLEELAEYYALDPGLISEKSAEWFGGGGAAHDSRYDTAMTWLCVLAATEKGDLRGIV